MAATKAKIAAAVAILVLMIGMGGVAVVWEVFLTPSEPEAASANPPPARADIAAATNSISFAEAYGLRGDEVIRRIAPPFVKARMDFYRKQRPGQAQSMPQGPDAMLIFWRGDEPQIRGMMFSGGRGYEAKGVISSLLKVFPQSLDGDAQLAATVLKGDISVKADADPEQMRAALEKLISQAAGEPVTLVFREVKRPVIVFSGTWRAKNADGTPLGGDTQHQSVEIYGAALNSNPANGGGGAGNVDRFENVLGRWINKIVIIEGSGAGPVRLSWHLNGMGDGSEESRRLAHDPELVCRHIQEQTGLTRTEETRTVRELFVERAK